MQAIQGLLPGSAGRERPAGACVAVPRARALRTRLRARGVAGFAGVRATPLQEGPWWVEVRGPEFFGDKHGDKHVDMQMADR